MKHAEQICAYHTPSYNGREPFVGVHIDGAIYRLTAEQALELAAELLAAAREASREQTQRAIAEATTPLPSLAEWVASERGLVLD